MAGLYSHVRIFSSTTLEGLWVKTQLTLYRNGNEGKLPSLSTDRITMLEDLGISWGVRRKGIPWEERFEALVDYKKRFGHVHVPWQVSLHYFHLVAHHYRAAPPSTTALAVHVPWQWKENIGLAQWVNTQRKKYKDLQDGKKNNLSEAQINMLNEIGFKWVRTSCFCSLVSTLTRISHLNAFIILAEHWWQRPLFC